MPRFIARRALLIASAILPMLALAQTDAEPKLPAMMKIVVPFGAGASNDAIARAVAPLLARRLGNTVIVENKPGAAGVIGSDYVAKSPADGSVLLLSSSTFVTAAVTQPRLPYDPLTAFVPVSMVGNGPMLLAVSAATPIKSAAELVAAAKAKPGSLTYGTSGTGSIAHLASEMLSDAAGIRMTHVPYKGAANALMDMAGGQIDMMISNYTSLVAQIKSGKVRALAVTSAQASPAFADLPPLSSVAPGFAADIWVTVFAPGNTPAPVVARLNRELNQIAASPEVKALLEPDGATPMALSPADLARRVRDDLAIWKKIAVEKKILAD
ncbi:MAG TPA: tripartite tricarboxylate transporter substrate-binding protein [Ottowia sp.]|jgi:tripartite-type tricarboxylate transporter receptor subunit TctC|nr:MAG: ABC transporter substrate-binding protein [Burkholderiales bacterium 68-10]HMT15779.1 tripartite tricarboxylate transporter substrate-binding protein [Ottowia sp.]HMT56549.1 tripartite tricarboxylate transporter substrate-binding protein [Ottowia sp.]HMT64322.1 tripartite tricarboxylate transporter substrate-binding protein [Ottowia sp.]HMT82115.1 tripartite tricarboxylate transporter substrate-binding protein [Ottowia sp.]